MHSPFADDASANADDEIFFRQHSDRRYRLRLPGPFERLAMPRDDDPILERLIAVKRFAGAFVKLTTRVPYDGRPDCSDEDFARLVFEATAFFGAVLPGGAS
jgi:hypothetical protein